MDLKQYNEPLKNLYSKTQTNSVSKLISGIILGLLLFLAIFTLTIILELFTGENEWMATFLHDSKGFGLIAGLILALEIWGLFPYPVSEKNEEE